MFVGREEELATLERLYSSSGFQMPVVYGRRRVGKTYLMSEFAKDKPTIFFTAVEDSDAINLRNLSREISLFEHPDADIESVPVYSDFQSAFEAVFLLARSRRLVLVIDEYPYLAKVSKSVSSILQSLIDRNKDESNLFLMLCGSSLSFMKEQVLGEKSPLYGRRTAQLEVRPFDFFDSLSFFQEASLEDAACYYGMVGGVPLYLQQFRPDLSLPENVEQAFMRPDSILFEEPTSLLKQEVQKAALYNSVIGAIASGSTENNTIATAAGCGSNELTYYLKELQRIGLVDRETPVVGAGRRAVYRLSDNLFRFWYRFVLPYRSLIERRITRRPIAVVEEHLCEYMGPIFEAICAEWLWRGLASGSLEAEFDQLGRWWGNNPTLRREEEIDLVGVSGGKVSLLGECKWRNEPVGADVVETLDERGTLVGASLPMRYLFSKTGFTKGCEDLARADGRLRLVTLRDMCATV